MLREYIIYRRLCSHVRNVPSRSPRKISRNFSKRTNTIQLRTRSRCRAWWLFDTRERHDTGGRIHSSRYAIDEDYDSSWFVSIVFCRFRENKSARKFDFYAGKPILFANMLVHVFDDGLSIVVSIPHCLFRTRWRVNVETYHVIVTLHHIILLSKNLCRFDLTY